MSSTVVNTKPNDFKHIIRILNTNVEGKRHVPFAITAIKGCGRRFAIAMCKLARIDPYQRAGTLTEEQCAKLQEVLEHPDAHGFPVWMLNRRRICNLPLLVWIHTSEKMLRE